jgi:hypothetical protein
MVWNFYKSREKSGERNSIGDHGGFYLYKVQMECMKRIKPTLPVHPFGWDLLPIFPEMIRKERKWRLNRKNPGLWLMGFLKSQERVRFIQIRHFTKNKQCPPLGTSCVPE